MELGQGFIYLCSPYSHENPWVREERYKAAIHATGKLMTEGHIVFCPIAHTHEIGKRLNNRNHEFWMRQDREILRHAAKVMVLMYEGWKHSKGIREEVRLAEEFGIPVEFIYSDYDNPPASER